MLVPKRLSRTKKLILASILIVVVVLTAYLVFGQALTKKFQFSRPETTSTRITPLATGELEPDFGISFLRHSPYSELREFGALPVQAGPRGRSNPFSPVPFSF